MVKNKKWLVCCLWGSAPAPLLYKKPQPLDRCTLHNWQPKGCLVLRPIGEIQGENSF